MTQFAYIKDMTFLNSKKSLYLFNVLKSKGFVSTVYIINDLLNIPPLIF